MGAFGSQPVLGGGRPLKGCLPLMLTRVADPRHRRLLVQAGGTLVSLGRMTERLHTGGQHLNRGGVRLGGMTLGRFQPLAGGGPALIDGPVSFSQLPKPRTDGGKTIVDLPLTGRAGPRLAVHASSMPDPRRYRSSWPSLPSTGGAWPCCAVASNRCGPRRWVLAAPRYGEGTLARPLSA